MGKYDNLTDFLNHQVTDDIPVTFGFEDGDKIGIT